MLVSSLTVSVVSLMWMTLSLAKEACRGWSMHKTWTLKVLLEIHGMWGHPS